MGVLLQTHLLLICIFVYFSAVTAEEIETLDREKRWAVAVCHPHCNSHSFCKNGVCICKPGCGYVHGICEPNVHHLGKVTHNHHHHHHGVGIIGFPHIHISPPISPLIHPPKHVFPPFRGGSSSSSGNRHHRKRLRSRQRLFRRLFRRRQLRQRRSKRNRSRRGRRY